MSLEGVRDLVPLPDADMVPAPGLFLHPSCLHGQAHVARVMVHALRLYDETDAVLKPGPDYFCPLWAAARHILAA